MCQQYNGWTNWETWVTKLWIDNDEYTYSCIVEMIRKAKDDGDEITADQVEEFVWETMDPDRNQDRRYDMSGLFRDFIQSSMKMVNWQEIADAYNKDGY